MALFKVSQGPSSNLNTQALTEGFCWFTPDDGKFYIDAYKNSVLTRIALNAAHADTATTATTAAGVSGIIPVEHGGTGANNAGTARTNLGLGSMATEVAADYIKKSTLSGAFDVMYSSAANTPARLAANTTTTKKFLSMTGTGSAGKAPTWATVTKSDVGLSNVTNHAQVTAVTWDSTNKKLQQSVSGGTATDIVTIGTIKTALNLTKADVALGNVPNVDATNASNISSGTLSADRLPTTGVTSSSASFGPSANASPAHQAGFTVPYFTVDKYGRITAASNITITLPPDNNVTQTNSTSNKDYRIILSGTNDDTTRVEGTNKSTNLRFNPSTKILSVGGSISATGDLTVTGDTNLNSDTTIASATVGALEVTGNATFTQIPQSVTPAASSNDNSIATTAFVKSGIAGLAGAMHFRGITTTNITDGSTTDPLISGYNFSTDKLAGDVVIDSNSSYEYIWTGAKWERLGPDGSYKIVQTAVTKPNAVTNKWVSAIGQNANGNIDVSYTTLDTTGTWQGNATTASTAAAVPWSGITGKPETYPPSSHTHAYLPLAGGTLTGDVIHNSGTGARKFYFSRGAGTGESTGVWVDDSYTYFDVTNDETTANVKFTLSATDSEGSDGSCAQTSSVIFNGANGKSTVRADYFVGDLTGNATTATTAAAVPWAGITGKPSTSISWTDGTTAGPKLTVTAAGSSANANIPIATASVSGVITTGAQQIAGQKTFQSDVNLHTADTDRSLIFGYGTNTTATINNGASWRIVSLGSGASDTNYFDIETTGSTTGDNKTWNPAVRFSMNTLQSRFYGRLNMDSGKPINQVIVGSGTPATSASEQRSGDSNATTYYYPAKWTFNTGITPQTGDIFTIRVPVAGHSWGVFLSIDNGAHYYPVAVRGTERLTTQYPLNNCLTVVFEADGSAVSMTPLAGAKSANGSTVSGGVFRILNYYDSGNSGQYIHYVPKAYKVGSTAITAYDLIAEDINGLLVPAHKIAHHIGSPIYICSSALSANATSSWASLYQTYYSLALKNSGTNLNLTTYKPVYLKGTISNGIFTPDTTTPYICGTENCNVSGAYYMFIGDATGSTNISLIQKHPYYYYDGTNLLLHVEHANVAELAGNVTGIVSIANGGTGASNAGTARTNLGLGSMATEVATNYIRKDTLSGAYDVMYSSAANTPTRLAANTTTTRKFLRMKGTGSAGAAPEWDTVTKSDVGLSNVTNHAQVTAVTWDTDNKKLQQSVSGGTATDIVTIGTIKTALALTKADVGLSNVPNVNATNASNITSGTLSADRLATSGVTAGNYGPSANASPAHAAGFSVPYITVDNKGRVTAASTKTITLPPDSDTKVTQTNITATTSADYRVLLSGSTNDTTETTTSNKNTNLRFNTGTKTLSVGGNITATGDLTLTGDAYLNNNTYAAGITTDSLIINGSARFNQIPTSVTPEANSNDTSVATTAFVMNAFSTNDAMVFKGVINANGDLPANHKQGWTYKIGTAGTYAGQVCEVGDTIYCVTDGTSANNAHWVVVQNNVDGAVYRGSNSMTNTAVVIADGTAGKVKSSGVTIDSNNNLTAPSTSYVKTGNITIGGTAGTNQNTLSSSYTLYENRPADCSIIFQQAGANKIWMDTSNNLRPDSDNTLSVGTSNYKWASMYATTFYGALSGNASSATKVGGSSIWLYPENTNELNFGGNTASSNIYLGYRAKDSKAIPSKFIFGSSTGTADLQAKTVYLGSGTTSYVSSTQYTGNAATATTADKVSHSLTLANNRSFDGSADITLLTNDLTPAITKVYESTSYYSSNNSYDNSTWYFMNVRPDSLYKSWRILFKIRSYCPNYVNVDSTSWVEIYGRYNSATSAHIFNEFYDRGHYYIAVMPLTVTGYNNGYGFAVGVSIRYATGYQNSNYYRTFIVDYYNCEGCTISFLDTPVTWANWTGGTTTNYGSILAYNACDRGLQETGDNNSYSLLEMSSNYIINSPTFRFPSYTLFGFDRADKAQALSTYNAGYTGNTTSINTARDYNTAGIDWTKGLHYYTGSNNYAAGANLNITIRTAATAVDLRQSDNCIAGSSANTLGMALYKPVYLRGVIKEDGLFYLAPLSVTYNNSTYQRVWTQDIPTTVETNGTYQYVYWFIGYPYYDSSYSTSLYRVNLFENNPLYWFHNGRFEEYLQNATTADNVAWSGITSKPTTIAGYGITDAKIENGVITLGSNTITPLTSHQDISGKVSKSGDTMTGGLTTTGVTISNTGANVHLGFSRTGGHQSPNYINVPANGSLAFSNGGSGGSNIVAMIDPDGVVPYSNNTKSIGTSTYKWASMYATTFYGALSGNASTATNFASAKTVALTGDITGSASGGASGGWSVATTLANSGVTANTYGNTSQQTPSHGGTFNIPYFTVDAKGRLTSAGTTTVKLPTDNNTDTKVTQTVKSDNAEYAILAKDSTAVTTVTATSNFAAGVTINPSTKAITASIYKVTTNATIQYNTTNGCLEIIV